MSEAAGVLREKLFHLKRTVNIFDCHALSNKS